MSIEQRLRDAVIAHTDTPPPVRDLVSRSIANAAGVRRKRLATSAAAAAMIAVAVPVALRASTENRPAPAVTQIAGRSWATASSEPGARRLTPQLVRADLPQVFTALPHREGRPTVEWLIGRKLIRPGDAGRELPELPPADRGNIELYTTPLDTVLLDHGARGGDFAVYVVGNVGFRGLVRGEVLGIAVDATRVAYSVKVTEGKAVTSTLTVVDIATGAILHPVDCPIPARPVAITDGKVHLANGHGSVRRTCHAPRLAQRFRNMATGRQLGDICTQLW